MNYLWEIREWFGSIELKKVEVVKETDQMYLLEGNRRVRKGAVDREPRLLGGGKFYTSRIKAIVTWKGFYQKKVDDSLKRLEALEKLVADQKALSAPYREEKDADTGTQ